jgi:hypothetical protein
MRRARRVPLSVGWAEEIFAWGLKRRTLRPTRTPKGEERVKRRAKRGKKIQSVTKQIYFNSFFLLSLCHARLSSPSHSNDNDSVRDGNMLKSKLRELYLAVRVTIFYERYISNFLAQQRQQQEQEREMKIYQSLGKALPSLLALIWRDLHSNIFMPFRYKALDTQP